MRNSDVATIVIDPVMIVESIKRLNAQEFAEFCRLAVEDNLGSRLTESLSYEIMDKDNRAD